MSARATHFDRGLQPERTLLAWRRTCLSLAACCMVAARVVIPLVGPWAVSLTLAGLALSIVTYVAVARAHSRTYESLLKTGRPARGAAHLAVGVATVGVIGLSVTVLVVTAAVY